MAHRHLNPKLLDKLLQGTATPDEMRELAWHLAEMCPDCGQVAMVDWQVSDSFEESTEPLAVSGVRVGGASGGLEEVEDRGEISFDRVRRRLEVSMSELFRQKDEAPTLVKELLSHPRPRQRMMIHNNRRYQTVPLVELWLDAVWAQGFDDPEGAEESAVLVLELLDVIEPDLMGAEILNDLRGRAWAYRGNCRRLRGDFRAARLAFREADRLVSEGSGDLLEMARLYDLESTLCRVQSRFEEARELIHKAVTIYMSTDERHLAGRTMVSQALLLSEEGHPNQAIQVLKEALSLIEPEREPHLVMVAHQNLMFYLTSLGRYEEAQALLPSVRRRTSEQGSRYELLRLRFLEGKIQLGLGHEARAEAAFLEVRKGFAELEVGYGVAEVSLELAALYLRQGRTAEIKQLAVEMVPLFESRDLHQEAIAALMLFKRAVEMETLTARIVQEVTGVLERSKTLPPAYATEAPS